MPGGLMGLWATWKQKTRALKRETAALVLAMRHPAVPWYAKVLGALIVAYALSPIDLIPDFIPVLGLLDDLLLLPLGLLLVRKLVPHAVLEDCRARAERGEGTRGASWAAAVVIVLLWGAVIASLVRWWWRRR